MADRVLTFRMPAAWADKAVEKALEDARALGVELTPWHHREVERMRARLDQMTVVLNFRIVPPEVR